MKSLSILAIVYHLKRHSQFGCMNVCIYLENASVSLTAEGTIASVLMERSRELPQFVAPSQGRTLRADQRLRNDIIGERHTHTHTHHENLYVYTEKLGE